MLSFDSNNKQNSNVEERDTEQHFGSFHTPAVPRDVKVSCNRPKHLEAICWKDPTFFDPTQQNPTPNPMRNQADNPITTHSPNIQNSSMDESSGDTSSLPGDRDSSIRYVDDIIIESGKRILGSKKSKSQIAAHFSTIRALETPISESIYAPPKFETNINTTRLGKKRAWHDKHQYSFLGLRYTTYEPSSKTFRRKRAALGLGADGKFTDLNNDSDTPQAIGTQSDISYDKLIEVMKSIPRYFSDRQKHKRMRPLFKKTNNCNSFVYSMAKQAGLSDIAKLHHTISPGSAANKILKHMRRGKIDSSRVRVEFDGMKSKPMKRPAFVQKKGVASLGLNSNEFSTEACQIMGKHSKRCSGDLSNIFESLPFAISRINSLLEELPRLNDMRRWLNIQALLSILAYTNTDIEEAINLASGKQKMLQIYLMGIQDFFHTVQNELLGLYSYPSSSESSSSESSSSECHALDSSSLDSSSLDSSSLDSSFLDYNPLDDNPLDDNPFDYSPFDYSPLDFLDSSSSDHNPLDYFLHSSSSDHNPLDHFLHSNPSEFRSILDDASSQSDSHDLSEHLQKEDDYHDELANPISTKNSESSPLECHALDSSFIDYNRFLDYNSLDYSSSESSSSESSSSDQEKLIHFERPDSFEYLPSPQTVSCLRNLLTDASFQIYRNDLSKFVQKDADYHDKLADLISTKNKERLSSLGYSKTLTLSEKISDQQHIEGTYKNKKAQQASLLNNIILGKYKSDFTTLMKSLNNRNPKQLTDATDIYYKILILYQIALNDEQNQRNLADYMKDAISTQLEQETTRPGEVLDQYRQVEEQTIINIAHDLQYHLESTFLDAGMSYKHDLLNMFSNYNTMSGLSQEVSNWNYLKKDLRDLRPNVLNNLDWAKLPDDDVYSEDSLDDHTIKDEYISSLAHNAKAILCNMIFHAVQAVYSKAQNKNTN